MDLSAVEPTLFVRRWCVSLPLASEPGMTWLSPNVDRHTNALVRTLLQGLPPCPSAGPVDDSQ